MRMKGFSRRLANCPQDSLPRRCGAVALFKSSSPQDQTKSPEPKFGAFRLSRRDKKDTLSQNSSNFLFALLGQSWRPLQHPFQIVGARYFPYGKRMLFVSPIKQQSI